MGASHYCTAEHLNHVPIHVPTLERRVAGREHPWRMGWAGLGGLLASPLLFLLQSSQPGQRATGRPWEAGQPSWPATGRLWEAGQPSWPATGRLWEAGQPASQSDQLASATERASLASIEAASSASWRRRESTSGWRVDTPPRWSFGGPPCARALQGGKKHFGFSALVELVWWRRRWCGYKEAPPRVSKEAASPPAGGDGDGGWASQRGTCGRSTVGNQHGWPKTVCLALACPCPGLPCPALPCPALARLHHLSPCPAPQVGQRRHIVN